MQTQSKYAQRAAFVSNDHSTIARSFGVWSTLLAVLSAAAPHSAQGQRVVAPEIRPPFAQAPGSRSTANRQTASERLTRQIQALI